jgi:hypothetical protein
MVLRETLTLAGIVLTIGLAGAYLLTRLIQAQLFGVKPTDLLTMIAASFGIAAVTAWQATSRRGELRDRSDERVEVGAAREARYREKSGLTEHLSGLFVDNFIFKELFFSVEPVVQF